MTIYLRCIEYISTVKNNFMNNMKNMENMENKEYRIVNIHQMDRRPGIIYAELRDESDELVVAATLSYIFDIIYIRGYNVKGVTKDKIGCLHLN